MRWVRSWKARGRGRRNALDARWNELDARRIRRWNTRETTPSPADSVADARGMLCSVLVLIINPHSKVALQNLATTN